MPNSFAVRIIVGITAVLAPLYTAYGNWPLSELMKLLATQKSSQATFVEKKYIGIIEKPLESSGELSFSAPDRLEKRTLRPKPETLILDGDRLIIERSNGHRFTLSLQDHPEMAAFVESIRGTLAGDEMTLEKFYSTKLTGTVEKWQLVLLPTRPRMLDVISRILIEGSYANVNFIEFEQADGDRSEMVVSRIVTR
ncbi:MAG: outer membrane lipoprotein carrier protein LolA [Sulfuricaulis sp.]